MVEESVLSDDFIRQLINVGEVDLMVAVPTYNDAKTISGVVQAVRLGLLQAFPRDRAVLVNIDGGSQDGSAKLVQQVSSTLPAHSAAQSLRSFHTVTASCSNGAGKASSLRLLLAAADLMRAKACAVLSPSADLTPAWVPQLLDPIYRRDFDFAAPLYRRNKFEGLLVRTLLYPMIRALWGKRIREPFGSDFGFSGRFGAELFMNENMWPAEAGELGEELLISMSAVSYGYRVCEVFLGSKNQAGKSTDLVTAIRQTVGTLFQFLDANFSRCEAIQASEPLPAEGSEPEISVDPLPINPSHVHGMFQSGVAELRSVLASILTEKTLSDLTCCAELSAELFRLPDELWARTVYEFAAAYHRSVISRDHIIQALVPLYRGKLYEFLIMNGIATADEVQARTEALCMTFEQTKPYLLRLWDGERRDTP